MYINYYINTCLRPQEKKLNTICKHVVVFFLFICCFGFPYLITAQNTDGLFYTSNNAIVSGINHVHVSKKEQVNAFIYITTNTPVVGFSDLNTKLITREQKQIDETAALKKIKERTNIILVLPKAHPICKNQIIQFPFSNIPFGNNSVLFSHTMGSIVSTVSPKKKISVYQNLTCIASSFYGELRSVIYRVSKTFRHVELSIANCQYKTCHKTRPPPLS